MDNDLYSWDLRMQLSMGRILMLTYCTLIYCKKKSAAQTVHANGINGSQSSLLEPFSALGRTPIEAYFAFISAGLKQLVYQNGRRVLK